MRWPSANIRNSSNAIRTPLEVRANLGAALAKLNRYDEAIEQYLAVLVKKDNAGLRLNLALAYYKKGAWREAVQQFGTLQAAQPNDVARRHAAGRLLCQPRPG